jgi:hypothetical protein
MRPWSAPDSAAVRYRDARKSRCANERWRPAATPLRRDVTPSQAVFECREVLRLIAGEVQAWAVLARRSRPGRIARRFRLYSGSLSSHNARDSARRNTSGTEHRNSARPRERFVVVARWPHTLPSKSRRPSSGVADGPAAEHRAANTRDEADPSAAAGASPPDTNTSPPWILPRMAASLPMRA